MKKISVLLVMLFVSVSSLVTAQVVGVEAQYGKSFSESNADVNYSAINVYKVGVNYTHDLGVVGIKTGLYYGAKGRQIDNRILGLAGMRNITKVQYLEVPVMASIAKQYSDKVHFYGNGGVYAGKALSAVNSIKTGVMKLEVSNDTDLKIGSKDGEIKPWDLGLQLEGGVRFGKIGVGLVYQHGLLDYSGESSARHRHRALTGQLTYTF